MDSPPLIVFLRRLTRPLKEEILYHRFKRFMDPELYRAATTGDWNVIELFKDELETELTPNEDTVLHVLSQFCDSSFVVEQILQIKPELILKTNTQKDTLLHIAARKGHPDIVRAVIEYLKNDNKRDRICMLSINMCGNSALHEAVKNSHHEIIKLLLQLYPSDQTNLKNKLHRCPLYLAVANGDESSVALILSTKSYKPPQYDDMTPLHAAAIWNFPECLRLILNKFPNLTKNEDKFGRTALHYAARLNHEEVSRQLLLSDRSIGYANSHGTRLTRYQGETALHVAVIYGHIQIIELLLTHCPDCWSMVTGLAKNVIHLAVENEQQQVLDLILKKPGASDLVNGRDYREWNTPLHLYVATKTLLGSELVNYPEVAINALNRDGLTPLDLLRHSSNDNKERQDVLRSELEKAGAIQDYKIFTWMFGAPKEPERETLNRRTETYQVISTLIITISFAAAFTVPGGYESNDGPSKGQPVFRKKSAFIAYVASDVVAMGASIITLVILLLLEPENRDAKLLIRYCNILIRVALLALLIAFVTGLYVSVQNIGVQIFLFITLYFCGAYLILLANTGL